MEKRISWQNFIYERLVADEELSGVDTKVTRYYEGLLDGLVLQLKADVLKEDMTNRRISTTKLVSFEHPRSPWQYLKLSHGHKWWFSWYVKMFPVRFRRHRQEVSCFHSINPMLLFPEQVVVPKKYGRVVRFVDIDEGEFRVYNQAADYRQTR